MVLWRRNRAPALVLRCARCGEAFPARPGSRRRVCPACRLEAERRRLRAVRAWR